MILEEAIQNLIRVLSDAKELKLKKKFKDRIIRYFSSLKNILLIDFWNKSEHCSEKATNPRRLIKLRYFFKII